MRAMCTGITKKSGVRAVHLGAGRASVWTPSPQTYLTTLRTFQRQLFHQPESPVSLDPNDSPTV
jgi:hypothetical protein